MAAARTNCLPFPAKKASASTTTATNLHPACGSPHLRLPCAVRNDDFSDAALVLVGHGSTLNADSSAPTYQHADELRWRNIFAQVLECFWKLEPSKIGRAHV